MQYVDGKWLPTVTDEAIMGFFGEYRWLSNFHVCDVSVYGLTYPSAEHAYMAQKTMNLDEQFKFTDRTLSCKDARDLGRKIELRPDWEEIKLNRMKQVLRAKFCQNEILRGKLLETGGKLLEETNYWGDKIWGVHNGEGQNLLGRALMDVRTEIVEAIGGYGYE